MYNYGLIGNCQLSALISSEASIDWLCLPRPDSAPVFGKLLDTSGGSFSISLEGGTVLSKQYYLQNTNILITELSDALENQIRVTDFCPRFEQFGRVYRPMSLFRVLEPIKGAPMIKVSCKPISGWNKEPAKPIRGNSHLQFSIRNEDLRLTTNLPLTFLCEEKSFSLEEKAYLGLSWSSPIEDDIVQVTERFLALTHSYWQNWVKHCSIPSQFQKETIRSALALKLHCYEDTGAILAALTTSLPEEPESGRNWDYRYCWLRDAYFVLSAFHNLGHFDEMEGFLKFILGIARNHEAFKERLAPVYTLTQELPLPETTHDQWEGYNKSVPVRTNNQAAEHIQNDVYGEVILALAPIYFDERFLHLRSKQLEELLVNLALLCDRSISQPDAGLWEIRGSWQEHSFTNLMLWAGLERIARIQELNYLASLPIDIHASIKRARNALEQSCREGSLRNGPMDDSYDASLSLAALLRLEPNELCLKTVKDIQAHLSMSKEPWGSSFFYRYIREDDFGQPESAFVICSFWVAQSLARLGAKDEARKILVDTIQASNHLGLFSEHFLPSHRKQLGNFPQAYSHVGLINAAFAVSPPWSDVL